jgi:phage gp46-like protein
MSDIALTWDLEQGSADFSIADNDLERDEGLETSVLESLFTDRRAEDGDVLPAGETDRRGWWGDAFPIVAGDKFGSRLWLLARATQTQDTLTRARDYSLEALAWMLEDKLAESVEVTTAFSSRGVMTISLAITRPKADPVQYRFQYTWASQEYRRVS